MPNIETMWDGWKSNTNQKLRPVTQYSQELKVFDVPADPP